MIKIEIVVEKSTTEVFIEQIDGSFESYQFADKNKAVEFAKSAAQTYKLIGPVEQNFNRFQAVA